MTKTAVATEDDGRKRKICPIHNTPMKYSRKLKLWYCQECLYGSFLTDQAQREAVKRYRQSEKGKKAERDYELSEKGRKAREKYLKGDKYKQRRREYNERLRESLQIARAAALERPSVEKEEEKARTETLSPLVQDIREYLDVFGRPPTTHEVVKWAEDTYGLQITKEQASELIKRASHRR